MNPILERDGTGAVEGHSALEALQSLIRSIDDVLDGCTGTLHEGPPHQGRELAAGLLPPLRTLAHEFQREHGDDPSLRLAIMRLEQRLRDNALADAVPRPAP